MSRLRKKIIHPVQQWRTLMLKDILETPTVLTDEELDAVAAGCGCRCNGRNGDNNSGTTVQVSILSAQADDGSNAGLIVIGNQSAG
jgi:hypothetical protein